MVHLLEKLHNRVMAYLFSHILFDYLDKPLLLLNALDIYLTCMNTHKYGAFARKKLHNRVMIYLFSHILFDSFDKNVKANLHI
jgi:hypothetical protein